MYHGQHSMRGHWNSYLPCELMFAALGWCRITSWTDLKCHSGSSSGVTEPKQSKLQSHPLTSDEAHTGEKTTVPLRISRLNLSQLPEDRNLIFSSERLVCTFSISTAMSEIWKHFEKCYSHQIKTCITIMIPVCLHHLRFYLNG